MLPIRRSVMAEGEKTSTPIQPTPNFKDEEDERGPLQRAIADLIRRNLEESRKPHSEKSN